ncbi:MAG TPA: hypothetical protein PLC03_08860 [Microthrixaceae bacterium]|nr:hypothetical protein [Microthrixaceae bacterium]
MTDPSVPGPPGDQRRSPWDPPAGPLPSAPPPPVPSGEGEAPPWGSWTPPATPGGPFPSAGGPAGASAGGSEPLRGVKGPRYGSPRFSGRGILAVFGLLGVLVTLGIMVLLVVRVLDGVGGSSAGDASDLDGLVTTVPAPSGPSATTASGPAGVSPAGPVGAAEAGACAADRETVSTAVEAYHVMNGSYPPDVQSLLDAGLVSFDGPVDMELHINGDTVVVVGTGPCAGR